MQRLEKWLRYLGIGAMVLAMVAILPSAISALGVLIALLALIMGGLSALGGRIRFALMTGVIVAVNLFGFSVLAPTWQETPPPAGFRPPPIASAIHPAPPEAESQGALRAREQQNIIWLLGVPYGIAATCVAVGLLRRSRTKS